MGYKLNALQLFFVSRLFLVLCFAFLLRLLLFVALFFISLGVCLAIKHPTTPSGQFVRFLEWKDYFSNWKITVHERTANGSLFVVNSQIFHIQWYFKLNWYWFKYKCVVNVNTWKRERPLYRYTYLLVFFNLSSTTTQSTHQLLHQQRN